MFNRLKICNYKDIFFKLFVTYHSNKKNIYIKQMRFVIDCDKNNNKNIK